MITLTSQIPNSALSWRNDPLIYKWCRQHTLISPKAHALWLERIEHDPTIKMFGIRNDQCDVGVCGLTSINLINRSAEFSLYIAPQFHRLGYGKLALLELLKVGFLNFGLNRIWGESFEGNPAQKVFGSIGFRHEGTLKGSYFREGKFIDSNIWAMNFSEYKLNYLWDFKKCFST